MIGSEPFAGAAGGGIAVGDGVVWVSNAVDGTVTRLDSATAKPIAEPIKVGRGPLGVTIGEGAVWVANFDGDSVTRVDPDSGETTEISVGAARRQWLSAAELCGWRTRPTARC